MRELKISGKSCRLRSGYSVCLGIKPLEEIIRKGIGEDFEGTVDIEISIKEIDTSLKIESNVEPVKEEETEE